jgi:DNA-binding SARP family transcriptional activator
MGSTVALRVNVLGAPRVDHHGTTVPLSPAAAQLLAFLVIGPREGRSRRAIASQLFSNCAEPVAKRRLATAVWRLRTELRASVGENVIDTATGDRIGLCGEVVLAVDALEFCEAVSPILSQPASALSPADAESLAAATHSYRGSLLESAYDEWVLEERDRLSNLYLTVLDYLIQYYGRAHRPDQLALFATRALELEPLREDFHRHVMQAYADTGRPDLVERQFETCRLALLRELGADPMPETVALYARLSSHFDGPVPDSIAALVEDLRRARRDVRELQALVDRAIDAVLRLR